MKERRMFPVNSFVIHKSPDGDWTVVEYVTDSGDIVCIYDGHDSFHQLCDALADVMDAGVFSIEYSTQEEYEKVWA